MLLPVSKPFLPPPCSLRYFKRPGDELLAWAGANDRSPVQLCLCGPQLPRPSFFTSPGFAGREETAVLRSGMVCSVLLVLREYSLPTPRSRKGAVPLPRPVNTAHRLPPAAPWAVQHSPGVNTFRLRLLTYVFLPGNLLFMPRLYGL